MSRVGPKLIVNRGDGIFWRCVFGFWAFLIVMVFVEQLLGRGAVEAVLTTIRVTVGIIFSAFLLWGISGFVRALFSLRDPRPGDRSE